MATKAIKPHPEDEMARCRRVREEFSNEFKSLDEMFEYLRRMEKERKQLRVSSKSAPRPARPRRKATMPVAPRRHACAS